MTNQRLRNLTTGLIHTNIADIKEDVAYFVGAEYTSSAILPKANKALYPFLEARLSDKHFFDKMYDVKHLGNTEVLPLDEVEMKLFIARYYGRDKSDLPFE